MVRSRVVGGVVADQASRHTWAQSTSSIIAVGFGAAAVHLLSVRREAWSAISNPNP
jgi:hypothetical protein